MEEYTGMNMKRVQNRIEPADPLTPLSLYVKKYSRGKGFDGTPPNHIIPFQNRGLTAGRARPWIVEV